jgi:glycosyltransferase involved in cell wall biosynthesis
MTEDTNMIVENPEKVREAEIIVGTPSYNEVETISNVTATADRGLREYFADKKAVIINADNHSSDGTKDAFLDTPTQSAKIYISTPAGLKGKGRNCRNLFRAAVELNAKAIVMVDSDLTSFTPKWIQYLGEPLFCGFDYVSPIYERHKYDASITNHFACPFLRMLYGSRIRQPIGGDFGFSGKLALAYLSEKFWTENVANFGIDIWMTTIALVRGFKVCQTFLNSSKSHRVKDPAWHLAPMFTNVIATIFDLMIEFEYLWKPVEASRPGSIFGFGLGVDEMPPVPGVDTDNLYNTFRTGYEKFSDVWKQVIAPPDFGEIIKLTSFSKEEFYYPSRLWVRLLYDFAAVYRKNELPRQVLIDSLVPFYYSRMLSFVNKTSDWGTKECEDYLEAIFRVYESEKPYLIQRWNQGKSEFLN